jgi:hypothetical protein
MEFQRTQHRDLMYRTTKELGYRVNCGVGNSSIEIYRGSEMVVLGRDDELCVCLKDWQKVFDSINGPDGYRSQMDQIDTDRKWTRLIQIPNGPD